MAPASLMKNPLNPHSFLATAFISQLFAHDGVPFILEYTGDTLTSVITIFTPGFEII